MSRTTPVRPLDVEALFPELAAHRDSTTRLHPRPGRPDPSASSVGGPLLWPSGEPWPVCTEPHSDTHGRRPADIRRDSDRGHRGPMGELNIFACPEDPDHPHRWSLQ